MKNLLSLLFLGVIVSISTFSQSPSVYEQLCDLNKFWKDKHLEAPVLQEKIRLKNDKEMIQMHLTLVEHELRSKDVSHLSAEQRYNRENCLDILSSYGQRGIFPKNIYHSDRTPYFIDHLGTACAVGHLIIETGGSKLAQEIHNKDNHGYVHDLVKKYPTILEWAQANGFTVEELAWIQPCYGCTNNTCSVGQVVHCSCYGSNDGCVGQPDPTGSGLNPPYQYEFYRWDNTGNQWYQGVPCNYSCDLSAGDYKWVVYGGSGDSAEFITTLNQPSQLDTSVTVNQGELQANLSGATYQWIDCNTGQGISGATSQTFVPQSPGDYAVVVSDGTCSEQSGCHQIQSVGIVDHKNAGNLSIFPNPTSGMCRVVLPGSEIVRGELVVRDLEGRVMHSQDIDSSAGQHMEIDLSNLSKGVYLIEVRGSEALYMDRLVKQ